MNSPELRNSFLDFFKSKNHEIVPSAPVVPFDDPTLLFINAGMNQFKNVFLGQETRTYKRAADTQKCIRVSGKHNDLEDVGFDTYHHTFFEMLGNWSFGDYFKKEAIEWAWELLIKVWGLEKERIWATVFGGDEKDGLEPDEEAEKLWTGVTPIPKERVLRFGKKDNFWEMGDIGPCGPCSEIHYDLGEGKCDKKDDPNHVCEVNAGCARYIEIWNLVFIQFNRDKESKLHNLPSKHVDTGMGFERVLAVINGTNSNYDTDLFTPLLSAIHDLTSVKYSGDEKGMAHRVISDHIRALTFAIADGAMPSNEGRGYVLRRILRRAARFGRNLDMHDPFIYKLVPVLVDIMGDAFPELKEKHQFVSLVIKSEEESFNSTLDRGIEIFEKITADVEKSGQKEIPGKEAFRLYDTYGFPLDLTQLMARQKNFSVDEKGFENAMSEQRDRARKAGKWSHSADFDYQNWQELSQGEDSKFLGYTELQSESEIRKFHIEDKQIFLILSQTPFYGEAGGQVGDVGEIVGDTFKIKIHDTVRDGSIFVHIGEFTESNKIDNSKVTARVDKTSRKSTARNHTATHLLHKALRETLGTHVTQAGSLVAPDHLRFDVSHFQKIAPQELEKIEARVNEKVRDDLAVKTLQKTYVEAREMGAMAIFEEKYGEYVRVVKIADFSMELCGGTHLNHTGEIGYFRILSESSAAAGIRRLEAVTGAKADTLLRKEKKLSHSLQEILNCSNEELVDKVQSLLREKHRLEKELKQLRVKSAQQDIGQLVNSAQSLDGFKIVTSQMASKTVDELKQISDTLRAKIGSGVGVLSSVINDKASFVCVVTDDLISGKNLKAGDIIKQVAAIADGSGGGRPHMALAGGKNINKIEQALEKVPEIVSAIINK
ncbi:alanine--tRNA ligase [candidate division KSB1 bacterium]|nr:alanine--tRNA ligase [candidate division KSB1 bacterium]